MLLPAATVVVGLLAARALLERRFERALARRLPRGPGGIARGAEPLELPGADGGDRGALLVHGFGDSPQSLAELARRLHAAGWAVRVPLLPGHGRRLADFRRARADDWLACVRAEWRAVRERYPRSALVGQSMGGALAAIVAAESEPPPVALVLLAPYLAAGPGVRRLARLAWAVDAVCPYVPSAGARSIHDPEARRAAVSLGALTARLARELERVALQARAALPAVAAPTLVVQSRTDNRIAAHAAEAAFRDVGARDKAFEWLEGCGHVVAVDYQKARVFELTARWLAEHRGADAGGERPAAPRRSSSRA